MKGLFRSAIHDGRRGQHAWCFRYANTRSSPLRNQGGRKLQQPRGGPCAGGRIMPDGCLASSSSIRRSVGVTPAHGLWLSPASSSVMTETVDCGSFCSSWLPRRMVRQSSQGVPNTVSINEPELVEAICDHVANCITPQWPSATQIMKRHVSTRPYFNNTVERISSLTGAVNGKDIDYWHNDH